MKNEIKILIAAIVVILIVLVGAFALSGSGPQPTATPTPVPVTATPTPVPVVSVAPSVVASVAPTVTPEPTVTPTPMPESGVKQTEFGYWITYPPLPPQNWSTNPRPNVGDWNVVYFDPTSANKMMMYEDASSAIVRPSGEPAVIHRKGNLSFSTTVGIYAIPSDNMEWATTSVGRYTIPDQPNLTRITNTYYNLTFEPGESEKTVYIRTYNIIDEEPGPVALSPVPSPFSGYVRLDIVEVEEPYHIGAQHEFTLNVAEIPQVLFEGYQGFVWNNSSHINYTGYFAGADLSGDDARMFMWLDRIGSPAGALPVTFNVNTDLSPGQYTIEPLTFEAGNSNALLIVDISKGVIMDPGMASHYLYISIAGSPNYGIGTYSEFRIYINNLQ